MKNKKIIKRENDFAKWYTSILTEADLIDYGLVKGTIIFKPYSWSIWTKFQTILNKYFEEMKIENCSMPLFIPFSDFLKEAKHIEGFSPELFKVTEIGNKKLEDPLVIRPTSEIIFCHYFSKNILSYNDLPMKLNQWCNVFRIEKNTRPFLRNSEFFWQEQHSIFLTEKEAMNFSYEMIQLYKMFLEKYLCIPVLMGEKTEYERFAGANITYTIEAIMQDGQALQCGTSHYLGQNFSKNFNIKIQNKNNKFEFGYQTSAGVSTRLLGALIMSHSDDEGLVLPPYIAPIQIKINSLFSEQNSEIEVICQNIFINLKKYFSIQTDFSDKSIGLKMSEGEVKGIPIQITIGPKELKDGVASIYYRDTQSKELLELESLNVDFFNQKFEEISKNLLSKAKGNLEKRIVEVSTIEEFKDNINKKNVILAYWDGKKEDEKQLKQLTNASSRCIKIEKTEGICFFTKRKTNKKVYFARAY